MSEVRIGISGWRYPPWRGVFYPEGLVQRRELEFASRCLSSLEINGTFYGSQKPASFQQWYAQTPENFVFSVKGTQFITHKRRLIEVQEPLARFFGSGVLELQDKLGPILWQFPPSFDYDPERMETFFTQLPRDTDQALTLFSSADRKLSQVLHAPLRPLRYAVEIRHASFCDASWITLLRKYGVASVVADTAGKWPLMEDVTADFLYLRLHGDAALYQNGYTDTALTKWAQRIRTWSQGKQVADARVVGAQSAAPVLPERDVFCYFDNTMKNFAPFDAQKLIALLGQDATAPAGWSDTPDFALQG